jgi:tetratricopeptide (TPR) repeat protein
MLFDLRGGGRRKTVQVTYIMLAVLMGGGLVLFGIGGSVSGGLVDAITGSSGSSSGTGAYEKRVSQTLAATRAHPKDAAAWANLARARFQLASTSDNLDQAKGTWTASGKKVLAGAAAAWEQHLKLAGNNPDDGLAGLMVQAYSPAGLNQPQNAVDAQEVITQARPTSATFANLAVLAYQAGNTRTGDLAAAKALSLSPKDLRANLKSQLDSAKQQSAAAAATSATPSATATPAPSGSKSSKKKSGGK